MTSSAITWARSVEETSKPKLADLSLRGDRMKCRATWHRFEWRRRLLPATQCMEAKKDSQVIAPLICN